MADKYLNMSGLSYLWGKIKDAFFSKTGGNVTGPIRVESPSYPQVIVEETTNNTIGVMEIDGENKLNLSARTQGNNHIVSIIVDPDISNPADVARLYVLRDGEGALYKLYGEHNVPAASDLASVSTAVVG